MNSASFGILFLFLLVLLPIAVTADGPVVWVDLGTVNVEHGLTALNAEDGQNEALTIGAAKCRHIDSTSNPPSQFIYFDYDRSLGRPRNPVYVTVEYFDEGFGTFRIQYDSADLTAQDRGAYKDGATELLLDSRQWRRAIFELPDARFDSRQRMSADFRLACSGQLAVRRVSIEMESSADFAKQAQQHGSRISASAGKLTPPQGMNIVFSGTEPATARDASQVCAQMRVLAPILKTLGATSVQSYVRWDLVQPSEDTWDWSYYDNIVSILKENGLKWNPRIVMGPAFATPGWFGKSKQSVNATCLEHNTESRIQSVWNPNMPARVGQFMDQFAQHYGRSRMIESVLIGISGDYGEAVYPVTGGGWTTVVAGDYHTHPGYWCGDEYARADFRSYVSGRYSTVDLVNTAWGTHYKSMDEVAPFIPDGSWSARARLDFLQWYRGRMTKWADYWLGAARQALPSAKIYLATGGDGQPAHGSDFAAQCKVAAKHSCGIRLTNEASDYPLSFAMTRLASSAGRQYGAAVSFESSGPVSLNGIAARVYNATTSKATGMHTYYETLLSQPGGIAAWSSAYRWLGAGTPKQPQVAVLFPETALALKWGGFYDRIMQLRDGFDFDLVDESMIRDGALARYKVLLLVDGRVIEREDMDRIITWVRSGGMVIASDFGGFTTVDGDSSLFREVFDIDSQKSTAIRSVAKGLSVYVDEAWGGERSPVAAIARALDTMSIRAQTNLVPDGLADGVFVTELGGKFLVYNSTTSDVERELRVGVGRRRKVILPAGSITEIKE